MNASMLAAFSADTAEQTLVPLLGFIAGMVVYAFFIFKFYRFLARRDIFRLDLAQYAKERYGAFRSLMGSVFYLFEHLFLFPLFIFFWFGVVTVLLTLLSKDSISQILLVSMALVASVRVTAYYSEALSQDLAKLLPLALLGVFLVDISYFSYERSWSLIMSIPDQWVPLTFYFFFTVMLEFVLRIGYLIIGPEIEEDKT
ncbi:hypothetical protein GF342_01960 [Candidatus Woesearchaeota archaeon]|nr:hypothetical protein [Candidatus Woesearchaeota archaeon]